MGGSAARDRGLAVVAAGVLAGVAVVPAAAENDEPRCDQLLALPGGWLLAYRVASVDPAAV